MNTIKIEFEIPEVLSSYVNIKDPEYHKNIKELMLYQLIKEEKISLGKAAEILEVDRITLITDLGKMGISYFDYEINEVIEDVENIRNAMGEEGKC